MDEMLFEPGNYSAHEAPIEVGAIQAFEAGEPMESMDMDPDFPAYPWEASPPFEAEEGALVLPASNWVVTLARPAAPEASRAYLDRITPRLPEDVRDGFVRGAGMFDVPVPPDEDLDDLLG